MSAIFINHTNHPSVNWPEAERRAAQRFGEIVDVLFPEIAAEASEDEVERLAVAGVEQILAQQPAAVLCQGEFTYTYAVVRRLQAQNIPVLAACSERIVEEKLEADGSTRRVSRFYFVRFRAYK